MTNRRTTLLWMKDLLEHMDRCHDQLQWASDGPTSTYLTESLLVDLTECRRLCEELHGAQSVSLGRSASNGTRSSAFLTSTI